MGAGMFFCRYRDAVAEAFRAEVSYMPKKPDGSPEDPYSTSVQWSRRLIGLKLFLALAELGESGYVEMIDRQAQMGDLLRESLKSSGWRIVNTTPLPVVCFTREGLNTSELLSLLREHQIAWMSEANLGGTPVIRACITSFKTTEADIHWVVGEMNRLIDHDARQAGSEHDSAVPAHAVHG
jgi:aromatic-L-amino-acid decarboxylase